MTGIWPDGLEDGRVHVPVSARNASALFRFATQVFLGLIFSAAASYAGEPPRSVPRAPAFATTGPEWPMPGLNPALTRYSGLDQITKQSVAGLQPVTTFSTGMNKGHEAAPLVVGDTMYFVTPFPNLVYALDLTQPGAPLKWKYRAEAVRRPRRAWPAATWSTAARPTPTAGSSSTRSTARPSRSTRDSGKELWRTKLGDINKGETITMAPLVVKDKVLVGNSGGEFGVRGWLTALDAATGKIAWRAYSTGPDSDVLIGPDFKPFYAQDQGKDLGVTHAGPATRGRSAAARSGAGSRYDPGAQPDLLRHRAIPARGTPTSAPATTSGPPASSRAMPTPGRRAGSTSSARTTCTTTTASTRTSCSTCR